MDELRELAQHRGLKLVKSRRRKAGVGDFGKFGLTDAEGKPLLGIGDGELTASAEDIEAYLRAGATGTWRQSAQLPAEKPLTKKAVALPREEDTPPAKGKPASTKKAAPSGLGKTPHPREREASVFVRPTAAAKPKLVPEPELVVRAAKPADGKALARLLGQLNGITIDGAAAAANLERVRKAGGGVMIAAYGDLVGCCAWTTVATLHRGKVGRISLLVVTDKRRQCGIGTRLLDAALAALAKAKCTTVEVMSDIDLKNSHNFFRSTGFEQRSYRFVRTIS
ncbi:GNAT family N-acetyltransferase [Sphingomonas immobilis]|uniref:GNAT family N-acetyltransferase n=1 Tax=Sphingomonas immobilis TaxID=3063997 RepID=A0ABT8ZX86_9SPHN|nr:GNAT family N-acetyltransferase [Sphingomonas sp. CA1-15]MDO7841908.1 GNAT family N-acetyltransferase [Sphingomonas sp. CA1-15]